MPQPSALQFEVMYGRKAKLPIDLKPSEDDTVAPMPLPDDANPDVLHTLTSIRKKLQSTISTNIQSAQEHQKRGYDRRHNSNEEISAGSTVYIKNQRRIHRMGSKMEPRWIGPYTVVQSLTKGRVKLKNQNTGKNLPNAYHASNLKVYLQEEAAPSSQSSDDCPSDPANDDPKQKALKRPWAESDDDEIHISKTHKQTKTFNPVPGPRRKFLSTALGLMFVKVVYCGRSRDLGEPRCTYIQNQR